MCLAELQQLSAEEAQVIAEIAPLREAAGVRSPPSSPVRSLGRLAPETTLIVAPQPQSPPGSPRADVSAVNILNFEPDEIAAELTIRDFVALRVPQFLVAQLLARRLKTSAANTVI